MSTTLRQQEILAYLERHGAVSVRTLTGALYVSEATIRRDLVELERKGALKRTFGGAVALDTTTREVPLFIRESLDGSAKEELCRRAAELVKDGDTVFLDGSSTVQYLARHLAHRRDVTVVTYSLKTATLLCEHHIKTYCTGGLLMENSLVCTGADATDFARRVNPDICFISCKGLSHDGKFTDTSEEETVVRRAFLQNARTRVFLTTQSKIGNTYFHTVCHANEVDHIFSDGALPAGIVTRRTPK